jgi:UDP-N-acetylglucosamine transferase subunit ALG13
LIFLTVGNWHKGFDRLVKAVDELVGNGVITDQVTAQTGYSSYKPRHLTTVDFCSPSEFMNLIFRAWLVISHAGIGTIMETIKQRKPIIVVPRRFALGEVSNDHQLPTARQLECEGKVLVAYEISELPDKLQQAKDFVPAKGQGGQEVIRAVEIFLEKLEAEKCDGTGNG